MKYKENILKTKIWKYNLVDEAIAGASSGMFPITGLDQRCIIFTIHLTSVAGHPQLCRTLFDTTESFFTSMGVRRRSASYSGLASFIDVNGSKFSGADRDRRQVHCHGFILIPWNTKQEDVQRLMVQLEWAAHQASHNGQFLVKSMPNAVEYRVFDCTREGADLGSWVAYAQKEAVRINTEGDLGVMLPFDIRGEYGSQTASQIEGKRNKVLGTLRSCDRVKIYRSPKGGAKASSLAH